MNTTHSSKGVSGPAEAAELITNAPYNAASACTRGNQTASSVAASWLSRCFRARCQRPQTPHTAPTSNNDAPHHSVMPGGHKPSEYSQAKPGSPSSGMTVQPSRTRMKLLPNNCSWAAGARVSQESTRSEFIGPMLASSRTKHPLLWEGCVLTPARGSAWEYVGQRPGHG
ncbi:hypothetical protein D3C71_1127900 [compost metagenome]